MASGLYAFGRQSFLDGDIDWSGDNIKVLFVDANDYTVSLSTHQFHSDIPGGAIVATSGNLASKTSTNGVADAADLTVATVTGDVFEALVIYKDTGVSGSSILIAYIDDYTGLPCTPNGSNITVAWPNDGNKIFML